MGCTRSALSGGHHSMPHQKTFNSQITALGPLVTAYKIGRTSGGAASARSGLTSLCRALDLECQSLLKPS
jgi:hypothetical protein